MLQIKNRKLIKWIVLNCIKQTTECYISNLNEDYYATHDTSKNPCVGHILKEKCRYLNISLDPVLVQKSAIKSITVLSTQLCL